MNLPDRLVCMYVFFEVGVLGGDYDVELFKSYWLKAHIRIEQALNFGFGFEVDKIAFGGILVARV